MVALNYSVQNIRNDVCQIYIYIYEKIAIQVTGVGLAYTRPNYDNILECVNLKWQLMEKEKLKNDQV